MVMHKKLATLLLGVTISCVALASAAVAMGERPEPEYKTKAREEQRIAKILDDQIAKCDPWSKLEFEVNGVVLRPLALVAKNLEPADPKQLSQDICTQRIRLTSFMISYPRESTSNPELYNKLKTYREWWYEQKLPDYMTVSMPPQYSGAEDDSLVERQIRGRDEVQASRKRATQIKSPNGFEVYEYTVNGTNLLYEVSLNKKNVAVISCMTIARFDGGTSHMCDYGVEASEGKIFLSFRETFTTIVDEGGRYMDALQDAAYLASSSLNLLGQISSGEN